MVMNLEKHKQYLLTEHKEGEKRIRPKHKNKDRIHYDKRRLDGPQKPFRAVISEREAGKSTTWLNFYDDNYVNGYTAVAFRRRIQDVTEIYIKSIERVINKFSYVPVALLYKTSDKDTGIVEVYVAEYKRVKDENQNYKFEYYNKRLFFIVIGLSNEMSRIKSLVVPNIKYFIFDEFILNTRAGEKYLKDEAFKYKEAYNTFQRECTAPGGLVAYFFGNPYSVYNPYFEWWGVDTKKLKPGAYINGDNYTIECYQITEELRQYILSKNPLYKFDDAYTRYAFGGVAINDENIPLGDTIRGAKLRYVFKSGTEYIGFYKNPNATRDGIHFFCEKINWNPAYARTSYCFDFTEGEANTKIFMPHNKCITTQLKRCISQNRVVYKDVGAYYLTNYIYAKL